MNTNLILNSVSEGTNATGKFGRYETSIGKMNCFDRDECVLLNEQIGKLIEVEYTEKNNFKNIKKFLRVVDGSIQPTQTQPTLPVQNQFKEAREAKDQSIYTSYAKDIFVAMLAASKITDPVNMKGLMSSSIELVKMAKEGLRE